MIVNGANLRTLGIGFKASFQGGLDIATTDHLAVATVVPSSNGAEEYGWLGKIPNVREWVGDRVIQNLKTHGYTIRNKDFELTVGVDRNDIEDDNVGIYGPMFREMGMSTGALPAQLIYSLLKAGFTTPCYDGQNFFDTAHPVVAADGSPGVIANTDAVAGVGAPWFLAATKRALKPLILQMRKDFVFVSKDQPTDDNVFDRKEYRYGADARMNVGFGFWQFIWGSKQPLNAANYATARAAMLGMLGDEGRPLGIVPDTLIVPPALEQAGKQVVVNQFNAAGASNEWAGTAALMTTPWLA